MVFLRYKFNNFPHTKIKSEYSYMQPMTSLYNLFMFQPLFEKCTYVIYDNMQKKVYDNKKNLHYKKKQT